MTDNSITVDLIALGKYVASAFAGSGIATGFIKWLWGRAIADLKASVSVEMAPIAARLIAVENTVNGITASIKDGTTKFKEIEEDLTETQFDLEKKMADVAIQSGNYRLQAAQDYVTHDALEGEIIKVASKYCASNCRGVK